MTVDQSGRTKIALQPLADEDKSDTPPTLKLDNLTPEIGWLLVTAGVIGVIMPGIPGTPFLIVGVLVITPGGTRRLSRWAAKNPKGFINSGMKQIGRFLDDLERRYPRASNQTS